MRVVCAEGEIQMLHLETILSGTLDLLKELQAKMRVREAVRNFIKFV